MRGEPGGEIAVFGVSRPTDQNIIPSFAAMRWQNQPRDFAQAPLRAVAGDCISDLFRASEADARGAVTIASPGLQDEARGMSHAAAGGGEDHRH